MTSEYIFINFFRSLAAYWVLVAHCMIWGGWYDLPLPSAKVAVDLFMMISGFLMAANAQSRALSEPLENVENWRRFWLRRFFRIAPAYYVSLVAAAVFSTYFLSGYEALQAINPSRWPSGGPYDPARIQFTFKNLVLHATFLFGLHPSYSFSTFLPDWSLSLEMQFYFVFPLIILLLVKFGSIRMSLVIAAVAFAVGLWVSNNIYYLEPSVLPLKLHNFIAGILIFKLLRNGRRALTKFAMVIALSLLNIPFAASDKIEDLITLPILAGLMILLGRLEITGSSPSSLRRILGCKFIEFSSDASYGVYLFHGFFISAAGLLISVHPSLAAMDAQLRVFAMLIFVTTCSYLVAWLVHAFVELPGIRWGKKIIDFVAPRAPA